jgi:hypothetical protein
MSEQCFSISKDGARYLKPMPVRLEKDVQALIEKNLAVMLNVRFVATEFTTPCQQMRMDTLALDNDNCPVIIEYKLDSDSSVINQGLFYLNWLLSNKAVFQVLVQSVLGMDCANQIDWSGARVICIAGQFTRYDTQAIEQIQANIDLMTYASYDGGLFILKLLARQRRADYLSSRQVKEPARSKAAFSVQRRQAPKVIQDRIERILKAITDLSSDLVISEQDQYLSILDPLHRDDLLGRLHLTEALYPKLRLELYAPPLNEEDEAIVRTKKTRNGFEFSVSDDQSFDLAIEWIRQLYARGSMGY